VQEIYGMLIIIMQSV